MSWLPFHLNQCQTHTLPHQVTEHQRSVHNIWSCIWHNQGFVRIQKLITEQLTASIAKNATYKSKNTYSTIINVADCKTCKKRLLAVEYVILIIYTYPAANTWTLYKSTDGPPGRPTDNLPNSEGLGDLHRTGPELTVRLYWQPGPPIWQRFGSDLDPDPEWRSGTIANTCHVFNSHVGGTLVCPSLITRANAFRCSFNTQNFWVITTWFAAVRLRPVPPTLRVVTNTERFGESWNLSCISVGSWLPISTYM